MRALGERDGWLLLRAFPVSSSGRHMPEAKRTEGVARREVRIGAMVAVLGVAWACATGDRLSSSDSPKAPKSSTGCDAPPESGSRLSMVRGLLVAHALGEIGGVPYTNSLEALRCNYARGYRWFEVDMSLTKDGQLVCFHPGNEHLAGLDKQIEQLTSADVGEAKYVGRYGIPSFRSLLQETERLGDVVLVTDTKEWSAPMVAAVKQAFDELPANFSTRVVLQSYGERDVETVKRLSRELRGEVILTLYMSDADDPTVAMLAQKYDVIGVVADSKRFSPWLAQRLHSANLPIVVHTINDHREIMKLTRAGADGFYTDTYRPYGSALADSAQAAECMPTGEMSDRRDDWARRDLSNPGAYALKPCAKRQGEVLQLSGCGEQVAIEGPSLSVPPGSKMHLELAVKAAEHGVTFWFEVAEKNRRKRLHDRVLVSLAPHEPHSTVRDVPLPQGSPGISIRLGLADEGGTLTVERLRVEHSPMDVQPAPPTSTTHPAAPEEHHAVSELPAPSSPQ